ADSLARAFLALGLRRGDRVAILLPNRPEWLLTLFAASKVGAIGVGISTFSTPREIAWTLDHCRPAAVVTMEAFRGRALLAPVPALVPQPARGEPGRLASERYPELRAVVCVDGPAGDGVLDLSGVIALGGRVPPRAAADAQSAVSGEDLCYILYTSGSTA